MVLGDQIVYVDENGDYSHLAVPDYLFTVGYKLAERVYGKIVKYFSID